MATPAEPVHERAVLELIHQRRAVRAYTSEPLGQATIHTLLDAAVHAPTAMHLEPWAFVVVQDMAALKRLSDTAKVVAQEEAKHRELLKAPGVSPRGNSHLALLSDPRFNIFYDAGTLIVICGRPMGPFVEADCWLAAENLMLAACAMGLGTCCIGFAVPALNTPAVKDELRIPAEVTAIAPIIVGVPSGPTPPVPRKAPLILNWVR